MPTLYTWKRKAPGDEETVEENEQRAFAGDDVRLFKEDGSIHASGVLDRLDRDTMFAEIDVVDSSEKEIVEWPCAQAEALEQLERREGPARTGRCAAGTANLTGMLGVGHAVNNTGLVQAVIGSGGA